jgi:1-hydroxycarotenoid 3,4-desaturase
MSLTYDITVSIKVDIFAKRVKNSSMTKQPDTDSSKPLAALVVGAGVGGLATAMRLQAGGMSVTLIERAQTPGGKIRTVPSVAGPVEAGPTVLTLRSVFDDLFQACGTRLDQHVTMVEQKVLARHFWPDGSSLDLFSNPDQSADAVAAFAAEPAVRAFLRFCREASDLFEAFEKPMMKSGDPRQIALVHAALKHPQNLPLLLPFATMRSHLKRRFADPRLAQLFGRYATYVGGSPDATPALLSLIWDAEARGVWRIDGGMTRLAEAMTNCFIGLGGDLRLATAVSSIDASAEKVRGVTLSDGSCLHADTVVFNGDPRALARGLLGPDVAHVAPQTLKLPRSHSALVLSFAASAEGVQLAHHNVFFASDPLSEFADLAAGRIPQTPSIYLCAQDRGTGRPAPDGTPERFEVILNAPPLSGDASQDTFEEATVCLKRICRTLAGFGLTLTPIAPPLESQREMSQATPRDFERLFPGSAGSLYGQSPHGLTAALKRPRATTPVRGLYLAGGGTHPGAGVPMAALSGQHAADVIMRDLGLT